MHEVLIKRTIWVAKCECGCGFQRELTDGPIPRESMAPCRKWVEYVEQSFTGPSLKPPEVRW